MRTVIAAFRTTVVLVFIALPCFVGCGGGSSEPEAFTKDTGPPEEGMVWNDKGEYWEFPQGGGGGYDYESGYSDDEVADQSGDDGYGDSDEVADTSGDNDYGGDADPYASSNDNATDNSYGANDYGGGDSIRPPADRDERRAREREAANAGYGSGYASTDGGYGAQGGGGGSVYKDQIEPLFRAHCYNCHGGGPRGRKGDLEIHTPEAITASGMVVPFKPNESELLNRLLLDPDDKLRMPKGAKGLSTQEVALVTAWIESGANMGGGGSSQDGYGGGGYGDGYGGQDPYAQGGRPGRGGRGRGRGDDGVYDDDGGYGEAEERRAPARPKNLAEAASVTFQRGNDLEAMNQLYAQSLVNKSPAAKQVLENYRFLPARRRATLAVRWGVGVSYKPKNGYEGSPRAPGVKQNLRDVDDDGDDEDPYESLPFKNELLDYYTGDIGDELVLRLQNRIEASFYGEVLRTELEKQLVGGDEDDDFDDAYNDGGGYGGGRRGRGGGGGYGSDGGGGSSDKPDGDLVTQIMPGVMVLGEAAQKKLFERADEQQVDLLAVIDVSADPDRRRKIANSKFRVRLYDLADRKVPIAVTAWMNNVSIQKARAEDANDETIIREINKIFEVADKGAMIKDKKIRPFKVTDFPNTTSENAKKSILKSVLALIKNESVSPLAKLSEVKFYQSRGLMSSKHVSQAFKAISPERAAAIAKVVDENELRTLLSDWLVVDEPEDLGSDDEEDRPSRPQRGFR